MDALTAIDTRASISRLGSPEPAPAELDRILLAGANAPDHGKVGAARFIVLSGAARDILAEAMADSLKAASPDASEQLLANERAKPLRAPVIIVAAAKPNRVHKVPEIEQVMSVAAAVQNMCLAAHALGYGAIWRTGGAAYDPSVKIALGLEADDHIVAFLYVGTPTAEGRRRTTTLEGIVRRL